MAEDYWPLYKTRYIVFVSGKAHFDSCKSAFLLFTQANKNIEELPWRENIYPRASFPFFIDSLLLTGCLIETDPPFPIAVWTRTKNNELGGGGEGTQSNLTHLQTHICLSASLLNSLSQPAIWHSTPFHTHTHTSTINSLSRSLESMRLRASISSTLLLLAAIWGRASKHYASTKKKIDNKITRHNAHELN